MYYIIGTITDKKAVKNIQDLELDLTHGTLISTVFAENPFNDDFTAYTPDEINSHAKENRQFFVGTGSGNRYLAISVRGCGKYRVDMIVGAYDTPFVY